MLQLAQLAHMSESSLLRTFRKDEPGIGYAAIVAREGQGLIISEASIRELFPDLEGIITSMRTKQLARLRRAS